MFMPNIHNKLYKYLMQIQYNFICKGNIMKGARGASAGALLGQGDFGGVPENPLGSGLSSTGTPQGGVGGRKSGI